MKWELLCEVFLIRDNDNLIIIWFYPKKRRSLRYLSFFFGTGRAFVVRVWVFVSFLQISFPFFFLVYYALCILILMFCLFLNTFAGPNDVYQIEI